MRVISFIEMLQAYEKTELDQDDQVARKEMLLKLPFSFIVEGGYKEQENLEKWIKSKIGNDKVVFLYYGKIGYDFGNAEYFFEHEDEAMKVREIVPDIYTLYPHSRTPAKAFRTIGFENEVELDPNNKKAIIFVPDSEV
jgi:hypothetical protein